MDQSSSWQRRLGERVHTLRRRQRMTLRELAKDVGTSYATLSRLENGQRPQVTLDLVMRIAQRLGVTLNDLVYGPDVTEERQPAGMAA